ncbi:TRAP transporter small permease [candidate division KSB1 bacterium]|nr:TRAP transporter small permease [candidate division KSB1 bacterium]
MIKKVLDKTLEALTAAAMALLVIVVAWQVITRFILNNPSSWTEELAIYMMIWVGLLGAAVALNRKAHLGIDYFVGKLKIKIRLYVELLVYLSIAVFAILVLLIGGYNIVIFYLSEPQLSPALGINVAYVYLAIPISGFFITFYSIEFFLETLINLRKK